MYVLGTLYTAVAFVARYFPEGREERNVYGTVLCCSFLRRGRCSGENLLKVPYPKDFLSIASLNRNLNL